MSGAAEQVVKVAEFLGAPVMTTFREMPREDFLRIMIFMPTLPAT